MVCKKPHAPNAFSELLPMRLDSHRMRECCDNVGMHPAVLSPRGSVIDVVYVKVWSNQSARCTPQATQHDETGSRPSKAHAMRP